MFTFLESLRGDLPPWLLDDPSDSFVGCVFSLVADMAMHYTLFANRGTLLGDRAVADDALPFQGSERLLPRYPAESVTAYAARLKDAWGVWELAATKQGLIAELEAFGFGPGIEIKDPVQWPTEAPVGYWSQFWIVIPYGSHDFTQQVWGSGYWGDIGTWGMHGSMSDSDVAQLKALIQRHKPVDWVCREVRFMLFDGSHSTLTITPYVP